MGLAEIFEELGKESEILESVGKEDADIDKLTQKLEANNVLKDEFELSKNAEGKVELKNKKTGKPVNVEEFKNNMRGEFNDEGVYTYDPKAVCESLGIEGASEAELSKLKGDFETANKPLTDVKQAMNGKKTKAPDIKSEEDLNNARKNLSPESQKQINELEIKIKNKEEGTTGSWVKTGLKIFAGLTLYDALVKHRDNMNGCWIIDVTNGQRKKVSQLTCNQACLDPKSSDFSSSFEIAPSCDFNNNGPTACSNIETLYFNPCKSDSVPPKDAKIPFPGAIDDTKNTCCSNCKDKDGKDNFVNSCPDSGTPNCSSLCQTSNFNLNSNNILQCVNVSLAGALLDFTGNNNLFNVPTTILDKFLSILKTVAYVILAVFGIYLLIRIILYFIQNADFSGGKGGSKKGGDKGNSEKGSNVSVTIHNSRKSGSSRGSSRGRSRK